MSGMLGDDWRWCPRCGGALDRIERGDAPRPHCSACGFLFFANMGVGAAIQEKKYLEAAVDAMTQITGQKPIITLARKSVAGFRLRDGMAIGCKVTLRRSRMYEFLDRVISLALPRVRDFRGVSRTAFDGHGNYSLGLTEQLVFPELNPDKFTKIQGMNITLVTSSDSDDESRELLRLFGMPFRQAESAGAA